MNTAKKITKFLFSIALTFSLVSSLTGCGNASSPGTSSSKDNSSQQEGNASSSQDNSSQQGLTTIRYATMTGSTTQWYGVIGQEKKIWEKYGLDVQVTEFANGIETVDSVSTGQADIGFVTDFAGLNRLGNTAAQTDIRFFEEQSTVSSYALYADPKTVTSTKDLKGKAIMVSLGTFLEYLNAVSLNLAGLSADDVTTVPVESVSDILAIAKKGQASAIWTTGDSAAKLADLGWKPIQTQEELGYDTYVFHVANNTFLTEHKEDVQNFIKAYEEINQYVQDHIEEVAELLNQKTGVSLDTVKNTMAVTSIAPEFTQESVDALREIDKWAVENKFYPESVNVLDFINTDALAEIYPDNVTIKK